MAIVEMSRVRLLGMRADRNRVLRIMQRMGCVQITEVDGAEDYVSPARFFTNDTAEQLGRVQWAISQLNRYDTTKVGLLNSFAMPEATEVEADAVAEDEARLLGVVEAAEECERRSGELRGQETRIRAQIDQLLPWKGLSVPVDRIRDSRDTVQYIGSVNNRGMDALKTAIEGLPATLERVGEERENIFVWVIAHRSARETALDALKAADFAPISFAGERGTISQMLDQLHAQQQRLNQERDALEADMKRLAVDLPKLKLLYELLADQVAREKAAERFAVTGSTFLMEGWVPAAATETLEKRLRAIAPDIALEFRAPTEDETPPSMLHNNRAAAPYETVVTSYSYPDYRGIDPTLIMAPFFACLFGMMLSDAGYGAVMAIAIPFIIHFLKPKPGMRNLMWIMFGGGVFTVIWGTVFNTWFGAQLPFIPTIIDTLNEPIPMMALCLGMGALHLFTGLGVAAYMNIKRGKYMDVIYDQVSWAALIIGVVLMLLPATATVGKIMAIAGVLIILLFAGRDKPKLVSRLISGGGALYNISSWLSDLLSYMRLFGMGLATGVIGMVMNMLAGLLFDAGIIGAVPGIAVLLVGHTFNFAINALGAYVHSCRLQYIEFFSKFYEDGGIPFTPLAQKPLYFAIRGANAEGVEE